MEIVAIAIAIFFVARYFFRRSQIMKAKVEGWNNGFSFAHRTSLNKLTEDINLREICYEGVFLYVAIVNMPEYIPSQQRWIMAWMAMGNAAASHYCWKEKNEKRQFPTELSPERIRHETDKFCIENFVDINAISFAVKKRKGGMQTPGRENTVRRILEIQSEILGNR